MLLECSFESKKVFFCVYEAGSQSKHRWSYPRGLSYKGFKFLKFFWSNRFLDKFSAKQCQRFLIYCVLHLLSSFKVQNSVFDQEFRQRIVQNQNSAKNWKTPILFCSSTCVQTVLKIWAQSHKNFLSCSPVKGRLLGSLVKPSKRQSKLSWFCRRTVNVSFKGFKPPKNGKKMIIFFLYSLELKEFCSQGLPFFLSWSRDHRPWEWGWFGFTIQ